jgi:triosephosphate isomerase
MEKYFIANWKMNNSFQELENWLEDFYENCNNISENKEPPTLIMCPPNTLLDQLDSELVEDGFEFLEYVAQQEHRSSKDFSTDEIIKYVYQSRPIKIGAQDCHYQLNGSFTGNISVKMLKDVNCEFVLVGHSERRALNAETNQIISLKASIALDHKITPIICIGENKEQREQGDYPDFILQQLVESLPNQVGEDQTIIIAYEPIWAIGTGNTATIQQIQEVIDAIRNKLQQLQPQLSFAVLYGGSVDSASSQNIMQIKGIDGLLIGKASLDAIEFLKIVESGLN